MEGKKNVTKSLLEMYHLMHRYHMLWYGRNFGGLDPWQGQGRILSALRRMHNISQKELGFILDIRPQSLGELLQKLEANEYIRRYQSPDDKRALIVELTAKGETFQLQKPEYDRMFDKLSAEERRDLQAALEKISNELNVLIDEELELRPEDAYY